MNHHKYTSIAAVLVLMFSSTSVLAASPTVALSVGGNIAPASCSPTITPLNLGNVLLNSLSPTDFTSKGEKVVVVNVSCSVPTAIIYNIADNRQDSAQWHIPNGIGVGSAAKWFFGLGKTGTNTVGSYTARIGKYVADGVPVKTHITSQGPYWLTGTNACGNASIIQPGATGNLENGVTETQDFGGVPSLSCSVIPATTHQFELELFPYIAPNDGRFVNGTTPAIDGNISIALSYI